MKKILSGEIQTGFETSDGATISGIGGRIILPAGASVPRLGPTVIVGRSQFDLQIEDAPDEVALEARARMSRAFRPNKMGRDGSPVLLFGTETISGRDNSARVDPVYVRSLPPDLQVAIREYAANVVRRGAKEIRYFRVVRAIGSGTPFARNMEWLIDADYPHLALFLMRNLAAPVPGQEPTWRFIVAPDAAITKGFRQQGYDLIFDTEQKIGYMFGVNYEGQTKMMGVMAHGDDLRTAGIAFHSHVSSYIARVRLADGQLVERRAGQAGASGTGKTSTGFGLVRELTDEGEEYVLYQDDINGILVKAVRVGDVEYPVGYAFGSEDGPYLKTDSLGEFPELTDCRYDPRSMFENIPLVDEGRTPVFDSKERPNSRAFYSRAAIPFASKGDEINVGRLERWLGITRNDFLPPVLLAPRERAGWLFATLRTVKTAAVRGGTGKEVIWLPGADPFIFDRPDINALMMQEVANHGMRVDLLNTGSTAAGKIRLGDTLETLAGYHHMDNPESGAIELPGGFMMWAEHRGLVGDWDAFIRRFTEWVVQGNDYVQGHPDFRKHPQLFASLGG